MRVCDSSKSREACAASAVTGGLKSLPAPRGGGRLTRRAMLARSAGAAAAMVAACNLSGWKKGDSPHLCAAPFGPFRQKGTVPFSPIWDAHVHLTNASGTVEERIDWLLEHAGRMGIERLAISMGTSFVFDPSPDELREANDAVLRGIARAPQRVMGFVYLSPKHIGESLGELDRCVRDGPMVGVKLWMAMRCSRPELDPLVRRAVELKAPILQHTFWHAGGNGPDESTPADMSVLAARHPEASFICAHAGADWERGLREVRTAKNVVIDVCGSDPTAGFVEMAVRELGAERVLYGSDAGGRSFASQLAKVVSADVPESAKRLILGGNLRRLLQPILQKKTAEQR